MTHFPQIRKPLLEVNSQQLFYEGCARDLRNQSLITGVKVFEMAMDEAQMDPFREDVN